MFVVTYTDVGGSQAYDGIDPAWAVEVVDKATAESLSKLINAEIDRRYGRSASTAATWYETTPLAQSTAAKTKTISDLVDYLESL